MFAPYQAMRGSTGRFEPTPWAPAADRSGGRTRFGGRDVSLPEVRKESLVEYHQYLSATLAFPFDAMYFDEHEGAACDNVITATRLLDAADCLRDPCSGIQCEVLACGNPVRIRLDALRVSQQGPRQQAIDDYRRWFQSRR